MDTDLRSLTEDLRLVLGLHEVSDDPEAVIAHASMMAKKAAARRDRNAVGYWRSVYQNAKSRLGKAAGRPDGGDHGGGGGHGAAAKPAGGHGGGGAAAPADKPKGFMGRLKAVGAKVKGAAKGAAGAAVAAAKKIKNAPAEVAKLVTDSEYRSQMGKAAAAKIKRGAAKAILHAVDEVEEVVKAGGIVGKAATGKKLTDEDKHVLRAGAKALATTVVGTLAMGGIAHLTASALATHFAAETAIKSVGKAAMYAGLATEEEKAAALRIWAEEVTQAIINGFDKLGDMDPELIASILSDVDFSGAEDEPETEPAA